MFLIFFGFPKIFGGRSGRPKKNTEYFSFGPLAVHFSFGPVVAHVSFGPVVVHFSFGSVRVLPAHPPATVSTVNSNVLEVLPHFHNDLVVVI